MEQVLSVEETKMIFPRKKPEGRRWEENIEIDFK